MEFFVPGLGQNMRWSAYSVCAKFLVRFRSFVTNLFRNCSAMASVPVSIPMTFADRDLTVAMIPFGWTSCVPMNRFRFTSSLVVVIKYTVTGTSILSLVYHRTLTAEFHCPSRLIREPELQDWLNLPKPEQRIKQPITPEMEAAIDRFYFNHYCRMFQTGAFARATASM